MAVAPAVDVLKGVGRAAGGALLFALPIFMTMEMWRLGVSMPNHRLALLIVLTIALALVLEHYLGFRKPSAGWREATVDAGVALLVGFVVAGLVLWVLSIVEPTVSPREALSVVALAALPATIGASFARSQLGQGQSASGDQPSYRHELFLMAAGAVVFAANIAPTEEVILVAAKMSEADALILVAVELAIMHAFVYFVDFKGGSQPEEGAGAAFFRFTGVGYVIAFTVSAYLLWSFGRLDEAGLPAAVMETVVLTLPAGVGAAAARLIL